MIRGPKPKPTGLKLVTGNPGKRAPRKREAKLPPEEPMPPPHLCDEAKVEWGRAMPHLMRCGLMSNIDRAAFAAYCQAYGRWVQAEKALAVMGARDQLTGGIIIKTTGGNAIQNPLVGAANKAMELMLKAAAEFGMTPSARTRINVDIPKDPAPRANGTTGAAPLTGPGRFFGPG